MACFCPSGIEIGTFATQPGLRSEVPYAPGSWLPRVAMAQVQVPDGSVANLSGLPPSATASAMRWIAPDPV